MSDSVKDNISGLTDSIVESYAADAHTQRVGLTYMPSRSRIVEIVTLARQLLFPGYFGQKKLTHENVRFNVGNLLMRLSEGLIEQITHCLCVNGPYQNDDACRAKAETLTLEFLRRVAKIREMLILDAQAAYDGDPAAKNIEEVVYCYPGYHAVTVYRVAHELHELGVPLMPRIMTE